MKAKGRKRAEGQHQVIKEGQFSPKADFCPRQKSKLETQHGSSVDSASIHWGGHLSALPFQGEHNKLCHDATCRQGLGMAPQRRSARLQDGVLRIKARTSTKREVGPLFVTRAVVLSVGSVALAIRGWWRLFAVQNSCDGVLGSVCEMTFCTLAAALCCNQTTETREPQLVRWIVAFFPSIPFGRFCLAVVSCDVLWSGLLHWIFSSCKGVEYAGTLSLFHCHEGPVVAVNTNGSHCCPRIR